MFQSDSRGFNGIHMFPIFPQHCVQVNYCKLVFRKLTYLRISVPLMLLQAIVSDEFQFDILSLPLLRPQGLQVAFRMPCHFDPHTADIRRIRRSYSKQQTRKETRHFIRKLGASLLFRSYPCCCMADTKAASVKHVQKSGGCAYRQSW